MYFTYCYVQQYLRMVYERDVVYTLHLYFTKKTGRRRRISGDALCRYIGNRMCSRDLAYKHACGCTLTIGADGGCHVDAGCKAACIYGVCIG